MSKAKILISCLLGESGNFKILDATKKLGAILNQFLAANIEDESPLEGNSAEGEPEDLSHLRSLIFAWIEDTHREIGSDLAVQKALDYINVAVRHHMRHETRDCLYNLSEPWNEMLRAKGLSELFVGEN